MKNYYKQFVYIITLSSAFTQQSPQVMQDKKKDGIIFNNQSNNINNLDIERTQFDSSLPRESFLIPYNENYELKTKYFGYDFFTQRDTIRFWENLPTSPDYLLGAGDELIISLWGETLLRESYVISREGKIYDSKVGLLNLSGKTIEDAKEYINTQFSRVYGTLKKPNPSTFIDVSLGGLKSINVNFVGHVNYPGVYTIHPFSNLINGLIQAGGVDTTGSLRKIIVKSNNVEKNIDLYNFLISGDIPKNIQLRDQDIVLVPPRLSSVNIDSSVLRPGIYESINNETIYDIINYAGGLSSMASSKISLNRIMPMSERKKNGTFKNFYIEYNNSKLMKAQDGDKIFIKDVYSENNFVELIGQVKNPGLYQYYEGMNVSDLLDLGGVFNDSTYVKSIYLNQAEIVRRNPFNRFEKIINIDLNNFLLGYSKFDFKMQNLDRLVIHANSNYFERKNVKILGQVKIPGSYPLIEDNENLNSIILRAGGLSSNALENGISIFRDKIYFEDPPEDKILNQIQSVEENLNPNLVQDSRNDKNKIKLAWEGFDINLLPGDSVYVKQKIGSVLITGQVYNPGLVEFQEGKQIRYYLNSAGGINNYGNRNNVIVIYPNGITRPWRGIRSPKIVDGSTIVVYQKADVTPFDLTEFASNTASLVTSIVTILVLSNQIQSP